MIFSILFSKIWVLISYCGSGASAEDIRVAGSIPEWKDPLEEGMATHSSTLVWRIPWTEEPGRLKSMGSQRVGSNLAHMHILIIQSESFLFIIG